jgi:hypothetical protein
MFCVPALAETETTPVQLEDLPAPPEPIQELLESAQVTVETGAESQRDAKLSAETVYRIEYNYGSRSTWRLDDTGEKLQIRIRYLKIDWLAKHRVWFRSVPETEGFWSNSLVQHELDHVRISSDPRFARDFEQRLRANVVLNRTVEAGVKVDRKYVNKLVEEHVATVFEEVSELIAIRYQELDRVTDHGRKPLPADSSLTEFLDPAQTQAK